MAGKSIANAACLDFMSFLLVSEWNSGGKLSVIT
jgi:hypothetical protein